MKIHLTLLLSLLAAAGASAQVLPPPMQPGGPANAAPNTSAPIRIAALITVMTLGQMIWRLAVGEGCALMARGSCWEPQSL